MGDHAASLKCKTELVIKKESSTYPNSGSCESSYSAKPPVVRVEKKKIVKAIRKRAPIMLKASKIKTILAKR